MSTKRSLHCACCGGDASHWEQWHNQDTGWGLCAPCAASIAGKGMDAAEMERTYGTAGIHREAPTHVLHGRRFRVLATFTNTERGTASANAYMTANTSASVLEVTKTEIILADTSDRGIKP